MDYARKGSSDVDINTTTNMAISRSKLVSLWAQSEYLAYVYRRRRSVEYGLDDGSSSSSSTPMSSSNCTPSERPPPRLRRWQAGEGRRTTPALPERSIHLGLITISKPNPSGCARTEEFVSRRTFDPFAWLLSTHRPFPRLSQSAMKFLSSSSRISADFETEIRNLKQTANLRLGVYRSKIHDRGLFSLVPINPGEMVIEYVGEVIRTGVLEKRQKDYTERGIQCFFYRLNDDFAIDGTRKGNASRFINHSCKPNCYSRLFEMEGKQHLIIISQINIEPLDEITCDYDFLPE